MLTQREADFIGSRMLEARDEIRQEMENVRAALNWASLQWGGPAVRRVLIALLSFYTVGGWHEGRDTFKEIAYLRSESPLARGSPDPSKDQAVLSARIHQAFLHCNLGQIDESEAISRGCLSGLNDLELEGELSECLHNLGVNASFRGDYERARAYLEEAILLGRECDHIVWPTYMLWLGHAYFLLGEYEQGLISLRKCYDLFAQRETHWGAAFALSKMGLAADGLGEHAQAMEYHQEALSVFERIGNQAGKGYSLSRMSMSAYFLGEYPQAEKLGMEGHQIFEEIGHLWGMCISLCRLGFAYLGLGDTEAAKCYFKDALQQSRRDLMIPLSLYALAGMACALMQEGEEGKAQELYQYVQRHPQTPTPYLEQAVRWMGELGPESFEGEGPGSSLDSEMMAVNEVIKWLLDGSGGHKTSIN
jgi:tetratricopeptide (TPR) repeat protein